MIALYLKKKRLEAGLSQAAVAEKLGYSCSQFVSNWERGVSEPPVATLYKLAEIYHMPMEEVFDLSLKTAVAKATEDLKKKFNRQA